MRRGFSLIELLVVLAIIAAIALTAAPHLKPPSSSSKDDIQALLRRARSIAAHSGSITRLVIDTRTGDYSIASQVDGGYHQVRAGTLQTSGIDHRGPLRFTFDPLGGATGDTISFGGGRGKLFVDAWTGETNANR